MSQRIQDINGWFEVQGNPISKVGVFEYSGKFISPDLDPNKLYAVLRPPEELSDPACIESFKLLPWTDNHPSRLLGLTDSSIAPEDKGIHGVIGEQVYFDDADQMLKANLKMFSRSQTENINTGKVELSAGYQCQYEYNPGTWQGVPYQYVQRNLRGNHISSVDEGRMGHDVSVMDSKLQFTLDAKEFKKMVKKVKKSALRVIMNGLLKYAADADEAATPAEVGEMKQLAALLKQVAPLMQQLADMPAVQAKTEVEEDEPEDAGPDLLDTAVADAEQEEERKKEEELKKATDADDDPEKKKEDEKNKGEKTGMDAKEIALLVAAEVKKALSGVSFGADAKEVMIMVNKKNQLASNLSTFIGTFDSSEMTLADVEKYGVKKLNLQCTPGQEGQVLSGFFQAVESARTAATVKHTGMDKGEGGSSVDKLLISLAAN